MKMTIPTRSIRLLFASIGLFLMSLTNLAIAQTPWDAESLMQKLGAVKEARLEFVEYRSSAFLVEKLKLTGRLTYVAPDFILKSVESPFIENIEIDGDKIIIEKVSNRGESSRKQYSLSSSEVLNTAVEGIRATLSGNLDTLNDNYTIDFSGVMESWQVVLVPKSSEILEQIEKISISGSNAEIRVIETFDTDGDETSLNLSYLMLK